MTGFEEFKIKIYSVQENEEHLEHEMMLKTADELVTLID